jgi:glycosyltransferase involved in cell wall biosynthesis
MLRIGICCFFYNSEETVEVVLENLKRLDNLFLSEIIIIDNNSTDSTLQKISLNIGENWKFMVEKRPGLTNARFCAIKNSTSDILIFCDDDNLFSSDYVTECYKLFNNIPNLGVLGPGKITPIDMNLNPLENDYKYFFQYKYCESDFIPGGPLHSWQNMPAGTGLCLKRVVALNYLEKFYCGKINLTDRIGDKLVSGGDTQLVLQGISDGFQIGLSGKLSLSHLTTPRKLKRDYLKKMQFGVYNTAPVLSELSPVLLNKYLNEKIDSTVIILIKHVLKYKYRSFRIGKYKHLISKLAYKDGILRIKKRRDYFLELVIYILKLK